MALYKIRMDRAGCL